MRIAFRSQKPISVLVSFRFWEINMRNAQNPSIAIVTARSIAVAVAISMISGGVAVAKVHRKYARAPYISILWTLPGSVDEPALGGG